MDGFPSENFLKNQVAGVPFVSLPIFFATMVGDTLSRTIADIWFLAALTICGNNSIRGQPNTVITLYISNHCEAISPTK
jgi:hypothetical protein